MRSFQDTLALCGMRDLSFSGEKFTWVNKRVGVFFVHKRLDRYVGGWAWRSLFSRAQVTNLPYYHSDHRAIRVKLGCSTVWVRKKDLKSHRFHFEEIWEMDKECKDVVVSSWNSSDKGMGAKDIVDKLKIVEKEKQLDILQNQDEIYWKQRSSMDWLAHGDRNSKVFHMSSGQLVCVMFFIRLSLEPSLTISDWFWMMSLATLRVLLFQEG
ncbi:hypothetical protein UlMin_011774 [Ulmus minor]